MSASSPSDILANKWKSSRAGRFMIFLAIFGSICLAQYLQEPVMQWLGLQDGSAGDQAPWTYIIRHFTEGICAVPALLLCLGVAMVMWRWWPGDASMIVLLAFVWHGNPIARSLIIYQACPGLLDGQRSASRWPTLESYMNDAVFDWAKTLVFVGVLLFSITLPFDNSWVRRRRSRKAE